MKNIRHVFFDLDHTLWDFEKNSTEAIYELFIEFNLADQVNSFEDFIADYQQINWRYWDLYNHGKIEKQTVRYGRFYELFEKYGIADYQTFGEIFADRYLALAPTKTNLFPDTHEVLAYLGDKYELHLITNGFKEVLYTKIRNTGLETYFKVILSAEEVGVNKPHLPVFQKALELSGALANESVMIGDSYEADILGAINAGMHAIFFNPKKEEYKVETPEIHHLRELLHLL